MSTPQCLKKGPRIIPINVWCQFGQILGHFGPWPDRQNGFGLMLVGSRFGLRQEVLRFFEVKFMFGQGHLEKQNYFSYFLARRASGIMRWINLHFNANFMFDSKSGWASWASEYLVACGFSNGSSFTTPTTVILNTINKSILVLVTSSPTRFILYSILFSIRSTKLSLSLLHEKIIESSFKPVFDLPMNRFESIRLDKWMFSDCSSFIWFRLTRRRQGKLWFTCFGGRMMKRG